jgi:predicted XRE-type DNA-binding protein
MASKSAERKEPVTRGTGNVFADLGFPDAAERQARLRLAYALNQELEARKISQADAAKVLGVTQPKVSALRRYKLEGFSVERLAPFWIPYRQSWPSRRWLLILCSVESRWS